jgi:uncharacterized protein YbaP (TraB family)
VSIRAFRRKSAVLAAIFLSLLCVNAPAQQPKTVERKHSLWKISSNSGTVYIFGSIHLLKEGDYPLDKSIEKAFDNSSRLFFEINLDTIDEQKVQQLTIAKGTYSNEQTLRDSLSNQTYEFTKKRLAELGMNIQQLEMFKPWLLAITMDMLELQKLGFDQSQGVDKYFYAKAKENGKKVDGFETAEYQLNLLADMPAAMQEKLLLQTMKELDEIQNEITAIVEAWKSGDSDALDTILLKSFKDYPGVNKMLIVDRNKNWLPKIESLIGQKENVMIIVGAAHLVGKDGIIALLKQKGYQVEQL